MLPYKRASELASAESVALALVAIAALMNGTTALLKARKADAPPEAPSLLVFAALVLAILTVTGNYCSARALAVVEPAVASVLYRTQVLFVAAGGVVFLGERVSRLFLVGTGFTLLGLYVMRAPLRIDDLGGAAWALGAAASFAGMQLVVRRFAGRLQLVRLNALRLGFAVAGLALVPGAVGGILAGGRGLLACVVLAALFGPSASRLCIMLSLQGMSAARASLVSLATPVFSFVLAYVFFGALPTGWEVVGGLLIVGGVALPISESLRPSVSGGGVVVPTR